MEQFHKQESIICKFVFRDALMKLFSKMEMCFVSLIKSKFLLTEFSRQLLKQK